LRDPFAVLSQGDAERRVFYIQQFQVDGYVRPFSAQGVQRFVDAGGAGGDKFV
jgi:hypothetical protein